LRLPRPRILYGEMADDPPKIPRKRPSASRRLRDDTYTDPGTVKYAHLLGEMVWAWNQLQHAFFLVFDKIAVHQTRRHSFPESIWNAVANDRAQRDILEAVTKSILPEKDKVRSRIIWSLDAANRLSLHRNDLIHSAMIYLSTPTGGPRMRPAISMPTRRYDRLVETELPDLMARMRGDCMALSRYVSYVFFELSAIERRDSLPFGPLPQKPQLRTLLLSRPAQASNRQPRRSPKPRRQRRPSRP